MEQKKNVLVQEIQTDPVKDSLYHTDFLEIEVDKPAKFIVPVSYTGKAKGADIGGIRRISVTEIELEGAPLSIPDECVINVSEMEIGDKISAGEIGLPEGVKLISKIDMVCVSIVAPS